MKDRVLLMGDVDAIKNYVFDAPGLPQIRGGSTRLLECEQKIKEYLLQIGGRVIYCSGGGFLAEVPSNQAERVKERIEQIYLDHTLVATVTVVCEDDADVPSSVPAVANGWASRILRAYQRSCEAGEFARRVAFLASRLRTAKLQKSHAPFMEAFPFGQRCDICGKRVAVHTVSYTEEETKHLCSVCERRYRTSQQIRHQDFVDFLKEKTRIQPNSMPPQNLNQLVESAHRPYLAFLYADGNNIGGLLQQVRNEKEYAELSTLLQKRTRSALFEALWEVCGPALEENSIWPFEILHIGGDDVTLLIQAGYAWEVAVAFLENFKQVYGDHTITASVGIAIADARYPVRYLEALASDLLVGAKKVARENETSAIHFLWLPNPIAATHAETLLDVYRKDEVDMTARPYTLKDAQNLQNIVEELSTWPRSLRYRWGEALEQGVWPSLSLIAYDLARRPSHTRKKMLELLEKLRPADSSPEIHPPVWWRDRREHTFRTSLLDALELAELRAMRRDVREVEDGYGQT